MGAGKLNLVLISMKIIFVVYIFDKIGLFLEKKGWIFYRKKHPKRASVADALQQINALLSRNKHTALEAKQNLDEASSRVVD